MDLPIFSSIKHQNVNFTIFPWIISWPLQSTIFIQLHQNPLNLKRPNKTRRNSIRNTTIINEARIVYPRNFNPITTMIPFNNISQSRYISPPQHPYPRSRKHRRFPHHHMLGMPRFDKLPIYLEKGLVFLVIRILLKPKVKRTFSLNNFLSKSTNSLLHTQSPRITETNKLYFPILMRLTCRRYFWLYQLILFCILPYTSGTSHETINI